MHLLLHIMCTPKVCRVKIVFVNAILISLQIDICIFNTEWHFVIDFFVCFPFLSVLICRQIKYIVCMSYASTSVSIYQV